MVTAPRYNPIARGAESYWVQSRQPLASLVFVAPLLVIYEAGVLLLGPDKVQNGADAWLRQFLHWIGFGQYFLLPLLILGILLGWHYTTRGPWRLSGRIFYGMTAECVLLAIVLRLLFQLQGVLLHAVAGSLEPAPSAPRLALSISTVVCNAVSYLGAGIYEELLFRLILLSLVVLVLRRFEATRRPSLVLAVLATSLLFAGAHYLGPERLHWFSFLFRFLAGVFFSVLFLYRGFGIAAGTHAGYDLLIALL